MSNTSTTSVRHTRSTRADLITTLLIGGLAALFVLANLVFGLIPVFDGGEVAVPVRFSSVDLTLPPGGSTVAVDSGVVMASGLPFATSASLLLSVVLPALASLVVIGCVGRVLLRLLRGQVFEKGTSRLITVAAFAILGGWIAGTVFSTMASNGALAAVGAADPGVSFTVSWLPALAALGVAALAILLRSGERMRADTEGLV